MAWRIAIACVVAGLSGCKTQSSLYCDEVTPCTDPERPFCDLDGDLAGSDGHGRTCVPDPFDAGSGDAGNAACKNRLAFDDNNEIYLINADGTGREAFTIGETARDPSWSPDGTRIAFSRAGIGQRMISTRPLDGGPTLDFIPDNGRRPLWSPAGEKIAYGLGAVVSEDIVVASIDDSLQIVVPRDAAHQYQDPSWAPDGSQLAFIENATVEIYRVNSDGAGLINLTNGPEIENSPRFSPDGTKIAFARREVGSLDLFVMDSNGANAINLTNQSSTSDSDPTWSPDGQRILFVSRRTGVAELHVVNADGTGLFQLTDDGSGLDSRNLAWSYDGRTIAFTRRDANLVASLHMIDVETRVERLIEPVVVVTGAPGLVWEPCPEM